MIVRCNLCGQEFSDDYYIQEERLQRHEEHHDGRLKRATYNIIRGKVKWLVIEDWISYSLNQIKLRRRNS